MVDFFPTIVIGQVMPMDIRTPYTLNFVVKNTVDIPVSFIIFLSNIHLYYFLWCLILLTIKGQQA